MKQKTRKQVIISIALILCALLSSTVLSRYLSSTSFHKKRIAYLDDKKVLVTGLSATATSLSALISMIPDDTGTPIANEIADAAGNLMGNAANTITDGAEKISEKASQIASEAKGIIKSIPDLPYKVSRIMNKLIEAFIVLIVTSCVIPILTMLFLMWYMTSILGAHIDYSFVGKMHRGKRKGMIDKSGTEVSTDNE